MACGSLHSSRVPAHFSYQGIVCCHTHRSTITVNSYKSLNWNLNIKSYKLHNLKSYLLSVLCLFIYESILTPTAGWGAHTAAVTWDGRFYTKMFQQRSGGKKHSFLLITVWCRITVTCLFFVSKLGQTVLCDPETFLLAIMGCGASVATETQGKRVETGKDGWSLVLYMLVQLLLLWFLQCTQHLQQERSDFGPVAPEKRRNIEILWQPIKAPGLCAGKLGANRPEVVNINWRKNF